MGKVKKATSFGGGKTTKEFEDGTKQKFQDNSPVGERFGGPGPVAIIKADDEVDNPKRETPTTPQTFTDEHGRTSGVELPDGRTFFGINPEQVQNVTDDFLKERTSPEGTSSINMTAEQRAKQLQLQEISRQTSEQITENVSGLDNQPILSEEERNRKAGEALFAKVGGFAVGDSETGKALTNYLLSSQVGGKFASVVGYGTKFTGIDIPGTGASINDLLFGDYEKTISSLQSDAGELETGSRTILMGVSGGVMDADIAIDAMNKLEEGTRQRYADAQLLLDENPDAIRQGIDTQESLITALNVIQSRKGMILKYKLTGDSTEIDRAVSTFNIQTP